MVVVIVPRARGLRNRDEKGPPVMLSSVDANVICGIVMSSFHFEVFNTSQGESFSQKISNAIS